MTKLIKVWSSGQRGPPLFGYSETVMAILMVEFLTVVVSGTALCIEE